MAIRDIFKTTATEAAPTNGAVADPGQAVGNSTATAVSDFLTVQSLANFSVMTGAITTAWKALQRLSEDFAGIWVPYAFAGLFAIVSLVSSIDGLKKEGKLGPVFSAAFIALINGLVLASAVVGTDAVTEIPETGAEE